MAFGMCVETDPRMVFGSLVFGARGRGPLKEISVKAVLCDRS